MRFRRPRLSIVVVRAPKVTASTNSCRVCGTWMAAMGWTAATSRTSPPAWGVRFMGDQYDARGGRRPVPRRDSPEAWCPGFLLAFAVHVPYWKNITEGLIVRFRPEAPLTILVMLLLSLSATSVAAGIRDRDHGLSVARQWDEELLDAIRRPHGRAGLRQDPRLDGRGLSGGPREPDRRGRDCPRPDGRLERRGGSVLSGRHRLLSRQSGAHLQAAGRREHRRPEPLAAAGVRLLRHAERHPHRPVDPEIRRRGLGGRHAVRPGAGVREPRERPSPGSGSAASPGRRG